MVNIRHPYTHTYAFITFLAFMAPFVMLLLPIFSQFPIYILMLPFTLCFSAALIYRLGPWHSRAKLTASGREGLKAWLDDTGDAGDAGDAGVELGLVELLECEVIYWFQVKAMKKKVLWWKVRHQTSLGKRYLGNK